MCDDDTYMESNTASLYRSRHWSALHVGVGRDHGYAPRRFGSDSGPGEVFLERNQEKGLSGDHRDHNGNRPVSWRRIPSYE